MTIAHESVALDDGELPLTLAHGGGTGAAIVIMPSAFGVAADLVEQMDELADTASLVVAFDPFFRGEPGVVPYDETQRVLARLQGFDRARAHADVRVAIEWTRERVRMPIVMLGICFGGPYALVAAADGDVDGVVTWHGTRMHEHLARAEQMRCPMRLHFGALDPIVPPPAVQAVRDAFAQRDDVRIVVHDGATHGFSHRAAPRAYDARAERAGMAALRELVAAPST
ncbi:MAG TPA: dienelactone hydrolase family protein [Nannocystaceae bacterium]|nr:dienelactone hydrolase family protein [Nannocystaceae bacterium]